MVQDGTLPRTRIAFSDPTDAGVQLAQFFIGDKNNGRYIIHLSYPALYNTVPNLLIDSINEPGAKRAKHDDIDEEEKENSIKKNFVGFEEEEDSN